MATSPKKVLLRTINEDLKPGYLQVAGSIREKAVELLDLQGRISLVPCTEVKWIAFVRDFNLVDRSDPERLTRRTFLARPRTEGLWVRLTLIGGELLEGLAPIDISLLDGLLNDGGVYLIPPDVRSNTQRLYIPRGAISQLQLLAVVTNPSKLRTPETKKPDKSKQESLFP